MSDSLCPHGLQHVRVLCPAPSPIGCWNSCPLSCWCYLTISSYVAHVSSCPQSFPASGCFPMRRLFTSGGQSIELQQQSFQWISLVQFSRSVTSNSLQPCGPQYTKPPCPSPTPRVYSNSFPLSQWCHSTITSSAVPFSSCPQSYQHQALFKWVSSSHQVAKVFPMNTQD